MRIAGDREDGAKFVILDGGLAVVLLGDAVSPAMDIEAVDKLGPWSDADNSLAERRAIEKRLRIARRDISLKNSVGANQHGGPAGWKTKGGANGQAVTAHAEGKSVIAKAATDQTKSTPGKGSASKAFTAKAHENAAALHTQAAQAHNDAAAVHTAVGNNAKAASHTGIAAEHTKAATTHTEAAAALRPQSMLTAVAHPPPSHVGML